MLSRRPAKEAPADVFWRGCVSDMKRMDGSFKFRDANHEDECKKSNCILKLIKLIKFSTSNVKLAWSGGEKQKKQIHIIASHLHLIPPQ